MDTTKFSQEKSITEFALKCQALQREIEVNGDTIKDLKSHIKSLQEAKDKGDEDSKALRAQTEKQKKKIEHCKEQMEKGNEYIQQLEEKKNQYKKQILGMKQSAEQNTSNKDTIIKKLEDQLQMKANEITEKNSQIREVNIDKQKLENDTAELQNLNAQLKTKLQESLKSLESNAQMIQWLNKQLNEK